jgi:hypothetical protein
LVSALALLFDKPKMLSVLLFGRAGAGTCADDYRAGGWDAPEEQAALLKVFGDDEHDAATLLLWRIAEMNLAIQWDSRREGLVSRAAREVQSGLLAMLKHAYPGKQYNQARGSGVGLVVRRVLEAGLGAGNTWGTRAWRTAVVKLLRRDLRTCVMCGPDLVVPLLVGPALLSPDMSPDMSLTWAVTNLSKILSPQYLKLRKLPAEVGQIVTHYVQLALKEGEESENALRMVTSALRDSTAVKAVVMACPDQMPALIFAVLERSELAPSARGDMVAQILKQTCVWRQPHWNEQFRLHPVSVAILKRVVQRGSPWLARPPSFRSLPEVKWGQAADEVVGRACMAAMEYLAVHKPTLLVVALHQAQQVEGQGTQQGQDERECAEEAKEVGSSEKEDLARAAERRQRHVKSAGLVVDTIAALVDRAIRSKEAQVASPGYGGKSLVQAVVACSKFWRKDWALVRSSKVTKKLTVPLPRLPPLALDVAAAVLLLPLRAGLGSRSATYLQHHYQQVHTLLDTWRQLVAQLRHVVSETARFAAEHDLEVDRWLAHFKKTFEWLRQREVFKRKLKALLAKEKNTPAQE